MAEENDLNINLRDYIWETEEHRFEPKENRHANVQKMKKYEAEKKYNSGCRKNKMEPAIVSRKASIEKKVMETEFRDHLDELE